MQDGAEWSLHLYGAQAPAAMLAPLGRHPALRPMKLSTRHVGPAGFCLANTAHGTVCLVQGRAPGCWDWPDAKATWPGLDPNALWSLSLATDWRVGRLPDAASPFALMTQMAARMPDVLIAVEDGRAAGRLNLLHPGFAAVALGIDAAQDGIVFPEYDSTRHTRGARNSLTPFQALACPVQRPPDHLPADSAARHAMAARAVEALICE